MASQQSLRPKGRAKNQGSGDCHFVPEAFSRSVSLAIRFPTRLQSIQAVTRASLPRERFGAAPSYYSMAEAIALQARFAHCMNHTRP